MSKTFRPYQPDQRLLLPPGLDELLPEGDLAYFIRDTVAELDLRPIQAAYAEERGQPPFHPTMMTALLLYAYCRGTYSSRKIAQACERDMGFIVVAALARPDFHTVARFRARHLAALSDLFLNVLRLCRRAGLVQLGHVALDGTKIKANASRHKAMSYERMAEAEATLAAQVKEWFAQARAQDREEDRRHGSGRRGDELPAHVRTKQRRLKAIREAKAALEAEASERAKAEGGPKSGGGTPVDPKAQRNFTDPDAKIMKDSASGAFVAGYNAQLAVDAASQVIVAKDLTMRPTDVQELPAMLAQVRRNSGRQARECSADAGYCSERNLADLARRRIRAYVAVGKDRHGSAPGQSPRPMRGPRRRAMATRLRRGGWRSRYRLRKQTVEPVFGQIKGARGFRQFLLRGAEKVGGEWSLVCIAHNLLKLFHAPRVVPAS
ncbi:MAG: IS1182 family transposase [Candidatus Limnocylindria bacterium]|nr:IS1182 family transposase [Candidatus Limnocylindria bacterium]